MGKGRCLSSEILGQLQTLYRQGLSQREIADQLGCSKTCVQQALKRLKDTGSLAYRLRPRPTPKTNARLDRRICRMSESNRRLTAVDICHDLVQSCGIQMHPMTVRRQLKEAGLHGRIARQEAVRIIEESAASDTVGQATRALDSQRLEQGTLE